MTVPDQPIPPGIGMANEVIAGPSKLFARLDSGEDRAGGGSRIEWWSVGGISGASFPALVVDGNPLGRSVFDGTGGEIKGAGAGCVEALGSPVGPGPSVVAGTKARGGSSMKPINRSVSQLAHAGSIDCSPVEG